MGCGASAEQQQQHHEKSANKSQRRSDGGGSSGDSKYAARDEDDDGVDGESYGEPHVELTAEEAKILAEIDRRSAASTAESAEEPSSFSTTVRVQLKVIKARVMHGIDGTCEDVPAEPTTPTTPQAGSPRGTNPNKYQFGDLKPRQVRKIADWAQKVVKANAATEGGYAHVPDRWIRRDSKTSLSGSGSVRAGSPRVDGGGGGDDTPRSVAESSVGYPETPKRFGRAQSDMDASPRERGSARNFDQFDVSDSGRFNDSTSPGADRHLAFTPPGLISDDDCDDNGDGGAALLDGGDDDGPTLDKEHLKRMQLLARQQEDNEAEQ